VRDRFDQKTLEMGAVDFVVEAMKLLRLRANRASWALANASREKSSEKTSTEIGFDLTSFKTAPGGRAAPPCLGLSLEFERALLERVNVAHHQN
jgi:hypothetical protein